MDHKLSGEKKYAKQALQESAQSEEDKSKYLKKLQKTVLLACQQEAQLSQRDRAMLHVIEDFVKSLKIAQGHLK